jgi:Ankyrin repeats (3 copies)
MEEIQNMLSTRPGDTHPDLEALPRVDSLLSACCGLVVLEDESQIVRLVHYTTEEYFARRHLYRSPECHRSIAGTLITYLNFTLFESFPPDRKGNDAKVEPASDSGNSGPDRGLDGNIVNHVHLDDVDDYLMDDYLVDLLEKNILLHYDTAHNWGNHAREALADSSAKGFGDSPISHSIATNVLLGRVNSWDLKQMKTSNMSCTYQFVCKAERFRYLSTAVICRLTNVTDLHITAASGIYYFVGEHLMQGQKADARDSEGSTPLHNAAKNGHVEIVQLLLDWGSAIEARDRLGRSALHWSVAAGRLSVMRLLLQRGSQPGVTNTPMGLSPMMIAAEKGHEEILELLAEYEANQSVINEHMSNALLRAASMGQEDVVRRLM